MNFSLRTVMYLCLPFGIEFNYRTVRDEDAAFRLIYFGGGRDGGSIVAPTEFYPFRMMDCGGP